MATHSSTLAWKIPWTEEPGRLQSKGSLRVGHGWATSLSCIGEGNGNPLQFLAWRIPGTGEPGGRRSMGSHRVGHDWSDLAAASAAADDDDGATLWLVYKSEKGHISSSSSQAATFLFPFPTLFQLLPCYLISSYYLSC